MYRIHQEERIESGEDSIYPVRKEYLWMDHVAYILCSILILFLKNLIHFNKMKADTGMLKDLHMLKKGKNWELA